MSTPHLYSMAPANRPAIVKAGADLAATHRRCPTRNSTGLAAQPDRVCGNTHACRDLPRQDASILIYRTPTLQDRKLRRIPNYHPMILLPPHIICQRRASQLHSFIPREVKARPPRISSASCSSITASQYSGPVSFSVCLYVFERAFSRRLHVLVCCFLLIIDMENHSHDRVRDC